jgi:hypothetical protein
MKSEGEKIEEFLSKAGGIEVILHLDDEQGETIKQFRIDDLSAPATLRDRIQNAQDIGLIEQRALLPDDHGNADRYKLTPKGVRVKHILEKYDVEKLYTQKKSILREWNRVPEIVREEFNR